MKKKFVVFLTIILAVSLVFAVGCNKSAGPEETIELVFATWEQPSTHIGEIYVKAADLVEQRTDGRVKIEIFFSSSLIEYADMFSGVASGRADMVSIVSGMMPVDLNRVWDQTIIGIPHQSITTPAFMELLDTYPELQEELKDKGVRWLAVGSMNPSQLHLTQKPVRVPKDLEGMRIIGGGADSLTTYAGGAALNTSPPDMYLALERGLADGQFLHWNAVSSFGLRELFKYHVSFGGENGGTHAGAFGFLINLDVWDSLPKDTQQVIEDVYEWAYYEIIAVDTHGEEARKQSIKDGHEMIELTPEELALWEELAVPKTEKWIKETEAKGWPAREVYEKLLELIDKYDK